eukprot:gnl/Hemi2/26423_TR8874_c0_g1_i1.p1 gnl/Hemi2/26423_TR8874_c0_g1~~gnl/Hemi2/26423_TR8874_c0_g1_i1.p1  ORF type:complete len:363 (+),score=99.92 gnl/Hemi2/26423_TR8874_c0_g1_i1:204-1292(+)
MGTSSSRLEKQFGNRFPTDERYFGLENFGNTCYCNSVLQALYFCIPFRQQLLVNQQKYAPKRGEEESLLSCLAELFVQINTQKSRVGSVAPRKFVKKLKEENVLFDNLMHQDAHEFLNYLLNEVKEILEKPFVLQQRAALAANPSCKLEPVRTWIHELFQGSLTNETKCLTCETVTSKDESFLDLSLEIQHDCSLTHCLRNFSATETLNHNNKFFCDKCCSLQEAQKRMKIKTLPPILALHLKRFKYIEQLQQYKKLLYRVVFPFELKISNVVEGADDPDREYHLFAVVIHVGGGPNYGHYVSIIKSHSHWLIFDDDIVELIEETKLATFFGSMNRAECGYILFYQAPDSMSQLRLAGWNGV